MYAMTAAHKTLPIPSYVRVRNPANGKEVVVRVNDRGPFSANRVIDLSYTAALKLGVLGGVQAGRDRAHHRRRHPHRRRVQERADGYAAAPAPRRRSWWPSAMSIAAPSVRSAIAAIRAPTRWPRGRPRGRRARPRRSKPSSPCRPAPTDVIVARCGLGGYRSQVAPARCSRAAAGSRRARSAATVDHRIGRRDGHRAARRRRRDDGRRGIHRHLLARCPRRRARSPRRAPAGVVLPPPPAGVPASAPPVVAIAAPARAEPLDEHMRAETTAAVGFWVQIGAYRHREGALDFQHRLVDEQPWLAPLLAVIQRPRPEQAAGRALWLARRRQVGRGTHPARAATGPDDRREALIAGGSSLGGSLASSSAGRAGFFTFAASARNSFALSFDATDPAQQ